MTDLEKIIEKQIRNIHPYVIEHSGNWNSIENGEEIKTHIVILEGRDEPNKNHSFLCTKSDFSYCNKKIFIVFDEKWEWKEIYDFLNKTINVKEIINSINNREIELVIRSIQSGIKDIQCQIFRRALRKCFKNIGIDVSLFDIFEGL